MHGVTSSVSAVRVLQISLKSHFEFIYVTGCNTAIKTPALGFYCCRLLSSDNETRLFPRILLLTLIFVHVNVCVLTVSVCLRLSLTVFVSVLLCQLYICFRAL